MRSGGSRRRGATCCIPAPPGRAPGRQPSPAQRRVLSNVGGAGRPGGGPQPRSLLPQGAPPGSAPGRQPQPALPAFAQPAVGPGTRAAAPHSDGRSSKHARWAMRSGGSRRRGASRGATCCIPAPSLPRRAVRPGGSRHQRNAECYPTSAGRALGRQPPTTFPTSPRHTAGLCARAATAARTTGVCSASGRAGHPGGGPTQRRPQQQTCPLGRAFGRQPTPRRNMLYPAPTLPHPCPAGSCARTAAVTGATQSAIRRRRAVRSGSRPQPRSLTPQGGPPALRPGGNRRPHFRRLLSQPQGRATRRQPL